MSSQLPLFGDREILLADGPTGIIRYYPALLDTASSRSLFDELLANAPWSADTRWMYDRQVDVPRLVASFSPGDPMPASLVDAKSAVERLLGERFTSVSLNYYRDGRDSVAWHSDRTGELADEPTIALLSLGAMRRMQLRTKARPRASASVDLDTGSLLVMSGRAQDFWEHCIPKTSRPTQARISVAFRPRRAPSEL